VSEKTDFACLKQNQICNSELMKLKQNEMEYKNWIKPDNSLVEAKKYILI